MDASTDAPAGPGRSGALAAGPRQRAGTSHATLAAYEAGRAVPRVDTLDRILRAAGYATDIDVERRADATDAERRAKGEELRPRSSWRPCSPPGIRPSLPAVPGQPAVSPATIGLPEKMLAIHEHLDRGGRSTTPSAVRWRWRGAPSRPGHDRHRRQRLRRPGPHRRALAALPDGVVAADSDRASSRVTARPASGGDTTPVDVFLNTTEFHEQVAARVALGAVRRPRCRSSPARTSPCSRPSSTARRTGPTSRRCRKRARSTSTAVVGVLATLLGSDDDRIARLLSLTIVDTAIERMPQAADRATAPG